MRARWSQAISPTKCFFRKVAYENMLLLFFTVASAWCANSAFFEIPRIWEHTQDEGVPWTFVAQDIEHPAINSCTVSYDSASDVVDISGRKRVICKISKGNLAFGGTVFSLSVSCNCLTQYGFVFSSPKSDTIGGLLLSAPEISPQAPSKQFSLQGYQATKKFCEYSAQYSCFTVTRFLLQYADGVQFFVRFCVPYDNLGNIIVNWGIRNANSANEVQRGDKVFAFSCGNCR